MDLFKLTVNFNQEELKNYFKSANPLIKSCEPSLF